MIDQLNERACRLVAGAMDLADDLRIDIQSLPAGGDVLDFGVQVPGGLAAGIMLARICTAGLADVAIMPGELDGVSWPQVCVSTDHPTAACLLSQYAGWQVSVGDYFAMGSGPIRAAAGMEELFAKLRYREVPQRGVAVFESRQLPGPDLFAYLSDKSGVAAPKISVLVAPTASMAGNIQVVARSVETALHKLWELGFDVERIVSAHGLAPLPPVAPNDLDGVGRTNDAILYGGVVTLWARGDDDTLAEIAPKVPSSSSHAFGRPFLEIFKEAGNDFYKIDPHLFSPAEVVFHNIETGRIHRAGHIARDVLRRSFHV